MPLFNQALVISRPSMHHLRSLFLFSLLDICTMPYKVIQVYWAPMATHSVDINALLLGQSLCISEVY